VLCGIAAEVTDPEGEAVTHTEDAELGDWVLLEEFADE